MKQQNIKIDNSTTIKINMTEPLMKNIKNNNQLLV